MAITLKSTGIQYSNSTLESTPITNASDAGKIIKIDTFTGSGTWYKPPGVNKVLVKVQGGGGGACGYCESGGAGGYAEKIIDVTSVNSIGVTIGSGGGATGYYSASGDGGTSSFGSYCSASGGYGANRNYSHTGGHGGVGSDGDINLTGGTGTGHANSSGHYPGATGGGSFFGGSSCVWRDSVNTKMVNGAPGSGGPGGRTNDGHGNGGPGENGLIVVYSYI
jgi:hypothetical protein